MPDEKAEPDALAAIRVLQFYARHEATCNANPCLCGLDRAWSTLLTSYETLQAENAEAKQVIKESIEWMNSFTSGEPMPNGRHAHLLICSGDYHKPSGGPGCVCNPRVRKLAAENADLRRQLTAKD